MKERSTYETIAILSAACIIAFFMWHQPFWLWLALCLIVFSLVFPAIGRGIHRSWYILGEAIGRVTGKLLLSVVYFLFVLPLAFFFRKKSAINFHKKDVSYFKERDHMYEKKDLENMW